MKQTIFILLALVLSFTACKKNNFDSGETDGVTIPNQIDPNYDNNNDVWRITTPEGTTGKIVITDADNKVVFETGNITDGWLPDAERHGLFHYFIKLRFADGKKKKYTGSVLVLD